MSKRLRKSDKDGGKSGVIRVLEAVDVEGVSSEEEAGFKVENMEKRQSFIEDEWNEDSMLDDSMLDDSIVDESIVDESVVVGESEDASIEEITSISTSRRNSRRNFSRRNFSKKQSLIKVRSMYDEKSSAKTAKRSRSINISELGSKVNVSKQAKPTDTCADWLEKYSPKKVSEVSVHSRKISQVKEAIAEMIQGTSRARLLVLTGPSGSGKSTLVKHVARELLFCSEFPVIEWENPTFIEGTSHTEAFSDFLKSAKYRQGANLSVILVEDLPFVFHEQTRETFQRSIYDWLHYDSGVRLPPLVICVTESTYDSDSGRRNYMDINVNYSVDTILGYKILKSDRTRHIKFNQVNKTLLTKTLRRIISSESLQPSQSLVDKLTQLGDIRSAILSLQFWASWSSKTTAGFLLFGKQSQLELFHIMGKIIYGSQKVDPNDLLVCSTMDPSLVCDFNTNSIATSSAVETRHKPGHQQYVMLAANYHVASELLHRHSYLATSVRLVALFVLENYSIYRKGQYKLQNAACIVNDVSLSDTLLSSRIISGLLDLCLNIIVRSARVNLSEQDNKVVYLKYVKKDRQMPDKTIAKPLLHDKLVFPRDFKAVRKQKQVKSQVDFHRFRILADKSATSSISSFNDTNLYHGYYETIINQNKLFKYKSYLYLMTCTQNAPENVAITYNLLHAWLNEQNLLISRLGGEIKPFDPPTDNPIPPEENDPLSELSKCYKNYKNYRILYSSLMDNEEDLDDDEDSIIMSEDENPPKKLADNLFSDEEILSDSDLDNF